MDKPHNFQYSENDSTGCIICAQEHDHSASLPQPPNRKRDPVVTSVYVIVPIALFAVFMYLVASGCRERIRDSKEYGAIGNLRSISEAEFSFRSDQGKYGTFEELTAAGKLEDGWNRPWWYGYFFSIKASDNHLEISAIPLESPLCSFLLITEAENDNHSALYAAEGGGHPLKTNANLIGESFGPNFDWVAR
jgi:hypothetical protein